jgi:hypothetical protein
LQFQYQGKVKLKSLSKGYLLTGTMNMKEVIISVFVLILTNASLHGMEKEILSASREKQKIEQRAALIVKNKELHFTDHAKQRMDARGISRGEIEQVIKSGARKVNKKRKVITYTGRYLTVLMAPDSKTVITVYETEKPIIQKPSEKEKKNKRAQERDIKLEKRGL